eukprot:m.3540 g.3540  ORF g.3540 m.3540 type:complete len:228 (+) comp9520_c0_seq1:92-775(+)
MEIRGTSKMFSEWSDRHAFSLQRCVRREAERLSRAHRMHEQFERDEKRRIERTMQRIHGGGRRTLVRKQTYPEAFLRQHVGVTAASGGGSRPTIPGKVSRACSLQLFSTPCFVTRPGPPVESFQSDVPRAPYVGTLAHAPPPTTSISISFLEPSDDCLAPDNSRDGSRLGAEPSGLGVPQITIRSATPMENGRGPENDNSLISSAAKYQQGKDEIQRLIRENSNTTT